MQRAGRCPIKVRQVLSRNRPQPVQIEVGIAKFQGVKGPLNEPDSPAQSFFTLEEFQHAANAAIAIIAQHTGHVGMEIRHAVPQACDRQGVGDHAAVFKRTQDLAAGVRGHHEHGDRLNLQIRLAPDLPLEFHAALKFLELLAFAHLNVRAHWRACPFANSRTNGFPSACFVASHRASICSRERFLNSRPDSRARSSMARNRRANFAFAFLSAISGSTSRNRARFTAANSRSPISSSILCWLPSPSAVWSSAFSSCIFAMTPAESSQSKPIREALRVS